MPSKARKQFDDNAIDLDKLLDLNAVVVELFKDDEEPLPEGYEVLFRSAVVLMVSHWEAYVEDICAEAVEHIVLYATDASKLPIELKKLVVSEIKKEPKHELEVWKLADDGWRSYLRERLVSLKDARNRSFNTPKSQQTADFLKNALGVEDIRSSWSFDGLDTKTIAKKLDSLIEVRGEIAHRGKIKKKLDQKWVSDHIGFLRKLVSKTGGKIQSHLKNVTGKGLW